MNAMCASRACGGSGCEVPRLAFANALLPPGTPESGPNAAPASHQAAVISLLDDSIVRASSVMETSL